MSTFGERLKDLRKEKLLTQIKLSEMLGLNKSSISRYEKNLQFPEKEILDKLIDIFEVSSDYLLGRSSIKIIEYPDKNDEEFKPELNKKDMNDIEKVFEETLDFLENQDSLLLDGAPMDKEDYELLAASLRQTLEVSKRLAKAKFTPHKYRK